MGDIQIFVSHRIDLRTAKLQNPLYIPMRCGAVYDKENLMGIAGDDTGDSISRLHPSLSEFTVQYWAWKNAQAEYYGLCHYRRFLCFADKEFPRNEHGMIYVKALMPGDMRRYGLTDSANMERIIRQYDLITSEPAPVENIPTPGRPSATVRQMWDAYDGDYFKKESIDVMFSLIDELAPEYSRSAKEYFAGTEHRGYNCYIMKKSLFDRLCRFQFPILFALQEKLDTNHYVRTPGYIGEMLYGIFIYHLLTYEAHKTRQLQLVFFHHADLPNTVPGRFARLIRYGGERLLRAMVAPLLPIGSKRRETLKRLLKNKKF